MTTPSDPDQPNYGSEPPKYGEQPSYGQQPNYGGLPSFPSAPPPTEAQQGPAIEPPSEMTYSFWCYVAAALISVVGGLVTIGQRGALVSALRQNNTGHLTLQQIDAVATASIAFLVVFTIVIGGLYLLFAFKLRQGRNWARIVLTIVAVLALLSLLFGSSGSVLRLVGDLAAIAGAVLSYLPNSSAYIAAVRQSRSMR